MVKMVHVYVFYHNFKKRNPGDQESWADIWPWLVFDSFTNDTKLPLILEAIATIPFWAIKALEL